MRVRHAIKVLPDAHLKSLECKVDMLEALRHHKLTEHLVDENAASLMHGDEPDTALGHIGNQLRNASLLYFGD